MTAEEQKEPIETDDKLAQKAAQIDENYYSYWDKWSNRYDKTTAFMYFFFGGERKYRRRMVEFGGLQENDQVLDLCCGTGSVTREIAEKLGEKGHVTALDLSPHMLAKAREKVDSKVGKDNASFVTASADELPFENESFDKVYVSFGLHELPDEVRLAAIKEVWRVLKKGGSFVINDYHKSKNPILRLGINAFVRFQEEKSAWRMLCNNPLPAELKQIGFEHEDDDYPIGGVFRVIRARKPMDSQDITQDLQVGQVRACPNNSCRDCRERICVYSVEDKKHRPNVK